MASERSICLPFAREESATRSASLLFCGAANAIFFRKAPKFSRFGSQAMLDSGERRAAWYHRNVSAIHIEFGSLLVRSSMKSFRLGMRFVSAALLAVVATGCPSHSDMATTPTDMAAGSSTAGSPRATAENLTDLDGRAFDLWSGANRLATAAIFVRCDCPVSNRHAPDIRKLHEQFHARGVEFYLIYVDPTRPSSEIRKHLADYALPCIALRDADHSFARWCGATRTPQAVLFDAGRRIVYRGRINDLYAALGSARSAPQHHDLRDAIEATLARRPVAQFETPAVGCPIGDL
jgi:cytochrome oxidase Cu insertion factor (SCO1/SenC/PrrC family)